MADACDLYVSPPLSRTWRAQAFPAGNPAVVRMSARELVAARQAWNFFELVETADAATRVRLGDAGWNPVYRGEAPASIWYPLSAPGAYMLHKRGQLLHQRICPNYDWTPQRTLGVPAAPIEDVGPALCPGCSSGATGANDILNIEPVPVCTPTQASAQGGAREVAPTTRQIPLQPRDGMAAPSNTPQSTTPKTATTPQSTTPKTATTPQSTTPKTATTPQPGTPNPPSSPARAPAQAPPLDTIELVVSEKPATE